MKKLSYDQVEDKIKEINFSAYDFDAILSIQNGGNFIGETISKITGKPLIKILIQRPDRKTIYKKIEKYNKFLGHIIYELLFIIDKPKVLSLISIPENSKVLVVDDAIHTGKTVKVLKKYLSQFKLNKVAYFLFTNINKNNIEGFSLYTEKIIFPWSENYNKK